MGGGKIKKPKGTGTEERKERKRTLKINLKKSYVQTTWILFSKPKFSVSGLETLMSTTVG